MTEKMMQLLMQMVMMESDDDIDGNYNDKNFIAAANNEDGANKNDYDGKEINAVASVDHDNVKATRRF